MIKRTIILLAVLLALSLSLASTASADEISGTGTIWAKGVGQAIFAETARSIYKATAWVSSGSKTPRRSRPQVGGSRRRHRLLGLVGQDPGFG